MCVRSCALAASKKVEAANAEKSWPPQKITKHFVCYLHHDSVLVFVRFCVRANSDSFEKFGAAPVYVYFAARILPGQR